MKKIISFTFISITVLLCFALVGCSGIWLDGDLKAEIIDDYLIWSGIQSDKTPEEIDHAIFGKYGDSVAIYFHTAGAYETPVEEEIAGLRFNYPDSRVIRIWNNGRFYKMPEAYELGLINYSDTLSIKLKSLFLIFKEPYFIYEDKWFPNYDMEELTGEAVTVYLDKGISTKNKVINTDFYAGVDIEGEIKSIVETTDFYPEDSPRWRQAFRFKFLEPSKEKALEYVEKLKKIDGIWRVEADVTFEWLATANDPLYYSDDFYSPTRRQKLEQINVPQVWDFTTGSREIKVGIMDSVMTDLMLNSER